MAEGLLSISIETVGHATFCQPPACRIAPETIPGRFWISQMARASFFVVSHAGLISARDTSKLPMPAGMADSTYWCGLLG